MPNTTSLFITILQLIKMSCRKLSLPFNFNIDFTSDFFLFEGVMNHARGKVSLDLNNPQRYLIKLIFKKRMQKKRVYDYKYSFRFHFRMIPVVEEMVRIEK